MGSCIIVQLTHNLLWCPFLVWVLLLSCRTNSALSLVMLLVLVLNCTCMFYLPVSLQLCLVSLVNAFVQSMVPHCASLTYFTASRDNPKNCPMFRVQISQLAQFYASLIALSIMHIDIPVKYQVCFLWSGANISNE